MTTETPTPSKTTEARAKLAALQKELDTLVKSVPALEKALEDARSGSMKDLLAAANALSEAVGDGTDEKKGRIGYLRDVGIPNATTLLASAEFDERFESIKLAFDPLRDSIRSFVAADETIKSLRDTSTKQIVFTVDIPDEGNLVSVSMAPRASRPATASKTTGAGGSRGSNVYTVDGQTYTSRELVEKFGDKTKQGVSNALATGTGLTHVADQIVKDKGGSKSQS
jgi:hypothetical protein